MWTLNKQLLNYLKYFSKWPVLITSLLTLSYKCTSPKTNSQNLYLKSVSLTIQFLLQNHCKSGRGSLCRRWVHQKSLLFTSKWELWLLDHEYQGTTWLLILLLRDHLFRMKWYDVFSCPDTNTKAVSRMKNSSFNQYVVIFLAWVYIESHFAGVYISNWGQYLLALGKHGDMLAHIMHWQKK